MGTDISGFVECRARYGSGAWQAAIDLELLLDSRDYDAFGCLFGVRNYANFRPLAAGRGLPADASAAVLTARDEFPLHSDTTWIGWDELAAVDWDEPAEDTDSRLHQFRQTEHGPRFVGKAGWSARFAEALGLTPPAPGEPLPTWPEGTEWQIGDTRYRAVRLTRREAVGPRWQPLLALMSTLGELHGAENVRLVVWFDD
ncbi:hypothetical protein [Kitasatospora phosalacinea]|uniref:Uncharacterized protein n=1 Tax=Kitasatospora phosalacinea TaxID=2065 RepID=A0ABW6GPD1_9ACTN